VHKYRYRDGQDGLQHNVDHDVLDGHQEGVPEQPVLDQSSEVVEADELWCPEQVVPSETEVEAPKERIDVEHQKAQQRWQDEDQSKAKITTAGQLVSPLIPGLKSLAMMGSTVSLVMRLLLDR